MILWMVYGNYMKQWVIIKNQNLQKNSTMKQQWNSKPLLTLPSPPTAHNQTPTSLTLSLQSKQIARIDKQSLNLQSLIHTGHTQKIGCIREKNELVVSGGYDGFVKLWDSRAVGEFKGKPLHSFERHGRKFNSLDVSAHILAAASGNKLTFWDLRKMKQRCQFTESFNDDITCVQFDRNIPTMLMSCCCDGIISKFDLAQTNEEEAYLWGHKILESPCRLQFEGSVCLIQTSDQVLITLEEESLRSRYAINDVQNPTTILHSRLTEKNDVEYFTLSPKNSQLNYWINNQQKGFLEYQQQVELLLPLDHNRVLLFDERGEVFLQQMQWGRKPNFINQSVNQDFMTLQELESFQTQKESKSTVQLNKPSKNDKGYIVERPSSFKSKLNKHKPYC